jgi:hypothetical protein
MRCVDVGWVRCHGERRLWDCGVETGRRWGRYGESVSAVQGREGREGREGKARQGKARNGIGWQGKA